MLVTTSSGNSQTTGHTFEEGSDEVEAEFRVCHLDGEVERGRGVQPRLEIDITAFRLEQVVQAMAVERRRETSVLSA